MKRPGLQLHNYGMRLRPLGIGCQPVGHYDYTDCDKIKTGYYGILTYARMLTQQEIDQYELTHITE